MCDKSGMKMKIKKNHIDGKPCRSVSIDSIPETKVVEEFVLERIRCTLPECENVEDMHFEYLK